MMNEHKLYPIEFTNFTCSTSWLGTLHKKITFQFSQNYLYCLESNHKTFFYFNRVASRLVFIPFVVGPRSPNGLEAQLSAEAEWKVQFEEALRALGALLALDMDQIINGRRTVKRKIANLYPDVDDRISSCENYGLLLAMADKVNMNYISQEVELIILLKITFPKPATLIT